MLLLKNVILKNLILKKLIKNFFNTKKRQEDKIKSILPNGFAIVRFENKQMISKLILKANHEVIETLDKSKLSDEIYKIEFKIKQDVSKILNKKQRDIAIMIHFENQRKKQNNESVEVKDKTSKKKDSPVILENFGKIIAVSSCKGGVGKSSMSYVIANLIAKDGNKVGFLDFDIYGPSIPSLLDFYSKFELDDNKKLIPIHKNGVDYVSVGFVTDINNALIWRGPMISKLINSFIFNCVWNKLDYTIIDLPPGTGDVHLSFFQKFQTSGVVLVSTDEILACSDLKRTINAFNVLKVPIISCIQNMSDLYNNGFLEKICLENNILISDKVNFAKQDNNNNLSRGDFLINSFNLDNTKQIIKSL